MKYLKIAIILFIGINFSSCTNPTGKDYTVWVNPFIGTEGDGNTFPGATMPFGAVQLSPDTGLEGAAKYGSYKYNHNSIIGFSHTHLNGVGEPVLKEKMAANPQTWQPFEPEDLDYKPLTHSIKGYVPLKKINSGEYMLGLWMPDADESIQMDSRYAVRVANNDRLGGQPQMVSLE